MSGDDTYVYRQSWEQERARLEGLSEQFDAGTFRHLQDLGVTAGWRCWEVGAGGGSVATWLADVVGPSGHVLVTDIDTRFVDELADDHVEVRRHDVSEDDVPHAEFDLVHARAVLEHVPQRERTLRRLVTALRPGGVLLLEDVVFGGTHLALVQPLFVPAASAGVLSRAMAAVAGAFRAAGADPEYGLLLPERLTDAGLVDVQAELSTLLIRGGSLDAQFYRLSLAQLSDRMIASGLLDPVEASALDEMLSDQDTHWPSIGMLSAWGRRPD
ncbi:methyltransferase domain-containing protein [Angustibacter luteus]|uniref:Class I SAM-dependent methyltransferase n=1 Tax=Angustibacter luteus TaxID=658456 RepID=A0ABW1JBQ1_9ACTN